MIYLRNINENNSSDLIDSINCALFDFCEDNDILFISDRVLEDFGVKEFRLIDCNRPNLYPGNYLYVENKDVDFIVIFFIRRSMTYDDIENEKSFKNLNKEMEEIEIKIKNLLIPRLMLISDIMFFSSNLKYHSDDPFKNKNYFYDKGPRYSIGNERPVGHRYKNKNKFTTSKYINFNFSIL